MYNYVYASGRRGGGEEGNRGAGRLEQEQEQDDDRRPSGAGGIYHPLHAMQKTAKNRSAPARSRPPHRAEGVSATSRARVHPT